MFVDNLYKGSFKKDFDSLYFIPEELKKIPSSKKTNYSVNQEFISSLVTNKEFVRGDRQFFRVQMEQMRRYSGSIIVDQKDQERGYNTTCLCGVKRLDSDNDKTPVNLVRGVDSQKLFFNGLLKCGSVWRCPVCSYKITQHRQNELYRLSSEWKAKKGNEISFITLTIRHRATFSLEKSLEILLNEFRKYQRTKLFKSLEAEHDIFGFVKTLEMTWGEENGWHPHLHLLVFHKSKNFKDLHKKFVSGWCHREKVGALVHLQKTKIVYSHDGLRGISDYMAKMDMLKDLKMNEKEYLSSRWDMTKEVTHSSFKMTKIDERYTPFSMLRRLSCEEMTEANELEFRKLHALYFSYCQATKGRHFIVISKKLKKYFRDVLGEEIKTDGEILEDEKVDRIEMKIDFELWDTFTKEKNLLPSYLINAYENGGVPLVLKLKI